MKRTFHAATVFLFLAGAFVVPTQAQKKDKDKKKPEPKVLLTLPLGSVPGKTVQVIIRGQNLDKATEVRFTDAKIKAKILNKGKAATPDKSPDREGDTQITAEVIIPPEAAGPAGAFVVVTPNGETKPHDFLIEPKLPVIAEKEPNDGFRAPQRIQVPQVVDGVIDRPQDVDVFAFTGQAGQMLVVAVAAGRHGSLLDPLLTLYDEHGEQLAYSEDPTGKGDVQLTITLPRTGTYYLNLMEAHDRGGATFPYRLVVRFQ